MSNWGCIAAVFDLDGTFSPLPSLERRLFHSLRVQGLITRAGYLSWFASAVRLLPRGLGAAHHESKGYLQNFSARDVALYCEQEVRSSVQPFFEPALDRLLWHILEGHAVAILSGTLEPLARAAVSTLESVLAARGQEVQLLTRATQLAEDQGRCTGRVAGHAMFGSAKAGALRELAEHNKWDLRQCFAYGDSYADRFMLGSVGRPIAVNPSPALRRVARKRGWPIVFWRTAPQPAQFPAKESALA